MMEHRYGRHGPRAWLRRWQRRYWRPPIPAREAQSAFRPPTLVQQRLTNVRVWQPTERIIVIMVGLDFHPQPQEPEQLPLGSLSALPRNISRIPPEQEAVEKRIRCRAGEDIYRLASQFRGERFFLRRDTLEKHASAIALQEGNKASLDTIQGGLDYIGLLERLKKVYLDEFNELLHSPEWSSKINGVFVDERQRAIAIKAYTDRQHHGSLSDSERRDLAVLAALEVRGLVPTSKISDELLTQLHADANWYEEVFDKGKEIIEWPPEESFRRQQSSSGD